MRPPFFFRDSIPFLCVVCVGFQQFPVFGGGHAFDFPEEAAEIEGVFVADDGGDLRHGVIGGFQQTGSVVYPDG